MKHLLTCFFMFTALTGSAFAEPALGRLFMTPEERRQVDLHPERTDSTGNASRFNRNDEDQITVNGLVVRNNGKRTIWINQQPLQEGQTTATVQPIGIPRAATVEVMLPGQNNTQLIKAGQSYDQINGSINENFNKKKPIPSRPQPLTGTPAGAANTINPNDFMPPIIGVIGTGSLMQGKAKTAPSSPSISGQK